MLLLLIFIALPAIIPEKMIKNKEKDIWWAIAMDG